VSRSLESRHQGAHPFDLHHGFRSLLRRLLPEFPIVGRPPPKNRWACGRVWLRGAAHDLTARPAVNRSYSIRPIGMTDHRTTSSWPSLNLMVLLATGIVGCGASSLEPPPSVIACDGGTSEAGTADGRQVPSPVDDANVAPGLPEFLCGGDVGAVQFELPCQWGMGPVYSVECATDHGHVNFFSASFSNGAIYQMPPLNQPITFKAFFSNPDAGIISGGIGFRLSGFLGTAVFSDYSIATRAFLGRVVHADSTWTANNGATIDCPMDNGLLWAIPGGFE
jgi:hypothetical protein